MKRQGTGLSRKICGKAAFEFGRSCLVGLLGSRSFGARTFPVPDLGKGRCPGNGLSSMDCGRATDSGAGQAARQRQRRDGGGGYQDGNAGF